MRQLEVHLILIGPCLAWKIEVIFIYTLKSICSHFKYLQTFTTAARTRNCGVMIKARTKTPRVQFQKVRSSFRIVSWGKDPVVALYDTFWKFIFSLNWAEKWFNSKFNSKQNLEYSFQKGIHSNEFKTFNRIIHSQKMRELVQRSKLRPKYGLRLVQL